MVTDGGRLEEEAGCDPHVMPVVEEERWGLVEDKEVEVARVLVEVARVLVEGKEGEVARVLVEGKEGEVARVLVVRGRAFTRPDLGQGLLISGQRWNQGPTLSC